MHHPQPYPDWYRYDAGGHLPMRLLTDDGQSVAGLSTARMRTLADLASAIHSAAWQLGEHELRHLAQYVDLQRWRR